MARPPAATEWIAWLLALVAGPLLLGGCIAYRSSPRQTILAADRVDLPTDDHHNGYLYIDVRINGAGPFHLLVDTGSDGLFLDEAAARAAGLKPRGSATIYGPAASLRADIGRVDRLEAGGLTLLGLDALFAESGPLMAHENGEDGIAGMTVFRDVVLLMDFRRHQVSVARPGTQAYAADRAVPYSGACPRVTIEVGGKAVPALLDTGSSFALILPDLDSYPLTQAPLKDQGLGGFGIGSMTGNRRENSQLAGIARLGPVTWTNPPLREQPHGQPGNIGVGVLGTFSLAFDQRARRVYFLGPELHREWPKAQAVDPRFWGGFLANLEGSGLRLVEVDAGEAFDLAGLRAGDVILTIDGKPAAEFPGNWQGARQRRLLVDRGGSRFETTAIFGPNQSAP